MSLHPSSKENELKTSTSLGKDRILDIALLGDCLTSEANVSKEILPSFFAGLSNLNEISESGSGAK